MIIEQVKDVMGEIRYLLVLRHFWGSSCVKANKFIA